MQLQNLKILVTGGAGFIGSNLCEYFLEKNKVVCLDNLSTGFKKNIEGLMSNPGFTFIEGDIRNPDTCRQAVKGVDYVFHQAALGSVPRSIQDPLATNDNNINGFVNMLVASRDAEVKRFVYASSSSVYGDSPELPKTEERIGNPLSPYAVSKRVNELYADVFSKNYGLECIGLRYFNVFGKRQSPDGAYAAVLPLWVKMLMEGKSPVINGDGSYSRDFTYIGNVILANEKAAITPSDLIKARSQENNIKFTDNQSVNFIFNIAFGGNTTLKELFYILRNNLSERNPQIRSIEPIYGSPRMGDIPHSHASIEKAQLLLGYVPEYDLAEGFRLACDWYWENLK